MGPLKSSDAGNLEIPVTELRKLAAQQDYAGAPRPSTGRRVLRRVTGFFIAASIGVGASASWQSYGDEVNKIIKKWAGASLHSLSCVSAAKSPPRVDVATEPLSTVAARSSADESALTQSAPIPQTHPLPGSAAPTIELAEQLEAVARNLAALQQSIAELLPSRSRCL
jgi:hypothetical protein